MAPLLIAPAEPSLPVDSAADALAMASLGVTDCSASPAIGSFMFAGLLLGGFSQDVTGDFDVVLQAAAKRHELKNWAARPLRKRCRMNGQKQCL